MIAGNVNAICNLSFDGSVNGAVQVVLLPVAHTPSMHRLFGFHTSALATGQGHVHCRLGAPHGHHSPAGNYIDSLLGMKQEDTECGLEGKKKIAYMVSVVSAIKKSCVNTSTLPSHNNIEMEGALSIPSLGAHAFCKIVTFLKLNAKTKLKRSLRSVDTKAKVDVHSGSNNLMIKCQL